LLIQQLFNGLVVGSAYAVFALGFTLLFGVNHILNMAYGSVFMWGAFAGLYVVTAFQVPFAVAMIAGMLAGGLLSIALELVAFRPLRRRQAADFATILTSIGANLVLLSVAQKVSNTTVMRFPFDLFPIVVFRVAGLRIQLLQIVMVGTAVLMVLGLVFALYRTGLGRRIRSVAYSEGTSRLLGINAEWVNAQVFFISGALAGLAGVLIGYYQSLRWDTGASILLLIFASVTLGGFGTAFGALVGSLVIGLITDVSTVFIPSNMKYVAALAVMIVILLVRPQGILGKRSRIG
jgi:branched-chain amino acid transport system permease protein